MIITGGMLVQWPTLLTLAMWPILAFMYYRLAKKEESDMGMVFGWEYREYSRAVPMFLPSFRSVFALEIKEDGVW
jgi:protein-S-isoprenylcysteine O-methyltransferase Ste14